MGTTLGNDYETLLPFYVFKRQATCSTTVPAIRFLADVNSRSRTLYAMADPSVCRLSVCDVGAPYSGG